MKAAMMLINAMAKSFDASVFHDTYQEKLKAMLDARARTGGAPAPKAKKAAASKSNVIDLMDVLQKSLAANKGGAGKTSKATKTSGSAKRTKTAGSVTRRKAS